MSNEAQSSDAQEAALGRAVEDLTAALLEDNRPLTPSQRAELLERIADSHGADLAELKLAYRALAELRDLGDMGRQDSPGWMGDGSHPFSSSDFAPPSLPEDFEIQAEIGRGGMGVVYRAYQKSLDRTVAVKVLMPKAQGFSNALKRFRAEARVLAKLRHPHIVPIHEVGESEGHVWFTMDLIEGQSLQDLIADGPLGASQAARILRQATAAIANVHGHGLIHRDLKPANILVAESGHAFVTDFGLVRDQKSSDASLTQTGQILGTPAWMSPEQARGDTSLIGEASDIYGLGATLYTAITGQRPFPSLSPAETLHALVHKKPIRPRRIEPRVPAALETICLTAMEKLPKHRYATANAMLQDLERFEEGRPIRAQRQRWERKLANLALQNRVAIASAALSSLLLILGFLLVVYPRLGSDPATLLSSAESLRLEGKDDAALTLLRRATSVSNGAAKVTALHRWGWALTEYAWDHMGDPPAERRILLSNIERCERIRSETFGWNEVPYHHTSDPDYRLTMRLIWTRAVLQCIAEDPPALAPLDTALAEIRSNQGDIREVLPPQTALRKDDPKSGNLAAIIRSFLQHEHRAIRNIGLRLLFARGRVPATANGIGGWLSDVENPLELIPVALAQEGIIDKRYLTMMSHTAWALAETPGSRESLFAAAKNQRAAQAARIQAARLLCMVEDLPVTWPDAFAEDRNREALSALDLSIACFESTKDLYGAERIRALVQVLLNHEQSEIAGDRTWLADLTGHLTSGSPPSASEWESIAKTWDAINVAPASSEITRPLWRALGVVPRTTDKRLIEQLMAQGSSASARTLHAWHLLLCSLSTSETLTRTPAFTRHTQPRMLGLNWAHRLGLPTPPKEAEICIAFFAFDGLEWTKHPVGAASGTIQLNQNTKLRFSFPLPALDELPSTIHSRTLQRESARIKGEVHAKLIDTKEGLRLQVMGLDLAAKVTGESSLATPTRLQDRPNGGHSLPWLETQIGSGSLAPVANDLMWFVRCSDPNRRLQPTLLRHFRESLAQDVEAQLTRMRQISSDAIRLASPESAILATILAGYRMPFPELVPVLGAAADLSTSVGSLARLAAPVAAMAGDEAVLIAPEYLNELRDSNIPYPICFDNVNLPFLLMHRSPSKRIRAWAGRQLNLESLTRHDLALSKFHFDAGGANLSAPLFAKLKAVIRPPASPSLVRSLVVSLLLILPLAWVLSRSEGWGLYAVLVGSMAQPILALTFNAQAAALWLHPSAAIAIAGAIALAWVRRTWLPATFVAGTSIYWLSHSLNQLGAPSYWWPFLGLIGLAIIILGLPQIVFQFRHGSLLGFFALIEPFHLPILVALVTASFYLLPREWFWLAIAAASLRCLFNRRGDVLDPHPINPWICTLFSAPVLVLLGLEMMTTLKEKPLNLSEAIEMQLIYLGFVALIVVLAGPALAKLWKSEEGRYATRVPAASP